MRSRVALVAVLILICATPIFAQATRTWVSGVGDDVNPCSRTAPCKTFAGAISKTAAGGEIDALDPGGYGAVTITKSITLDGGTGSGWASILNSGGISGVIINSNGAKVRLRNISINGAGTTLGTNGVRVLQAAEVHLDNVTMQSQSNRAFDCSINAGGTTVEVSIINTTAANNTGNGFVFTPASGFAAKVFIENTKAHQNNADGFFFERSTGWVKNISSAGNAAGLTASEPLGTTTELVVINAVLSDNATGINFSNAATVQLAGSVITRNTNGVNISTGTLQSLGNNLISLNGANNGPFPLIPGNPQ